MLITALISKPQFPGRLNQNTHDYFHWMNVYFFDHSSPQANNKNLNFQNGISSFSILFIQVKHLLLKEAFCCRYLLTLKQLSRSLIFSQEINKHTEVFPLQCFMWVQLGDLLRSDSDSFLYSFKLQITWIARYLQSFYWTTMKLLFNTVKFVYFFSTTSFPPLCTFNRGDWNLLWCGFQKQIFVILHLLLKKNHTIVKRLDLYCFEYDKFLNSF